MIHYEQSGGYYVLIGVGYNLCCYSLPELQKQALTIYNLDILTILN